MEPQRGGGAGQSFLKELCALLGVPESDPTQADESKNTYVFEKAVKLNNGDGTSSIGRVDLYRQNTFVLESKQRRPAGERTRRSIGDCDETGLARGKAPHREEPRIGHRRCGQRISRRNDTSKPCQSWPPFLIVCDVGYCFDIYADFSCSGIPESHLAGTALPCPIEEVSQGHLITCRPTGKARHVETCLLSCQAAFRSFWGRCGA